MVLFTQNILSTGPILSHNTGKSWHVNRNSPTVDETYIPPLTGITIEKNLTVIDR
jgi:hypothetical protein